MGDFSVQSKHSENHDFVDKSTIFPVLQYIVNLTWFSIHLQKYATSRSILTRHIFEENYKHCYELHGTNYLCLSWKTKETYWWNDTLLWVTLLNKYHHIIDNVPCWGHHSTLMTIDMSNSWPALVALTRKYIFHSVFNIDKKVLL